MEYNTRMRESWFPSLPEIPSALARDIMDTCGGSLCPTLFQTEPHALRVLLLLALLPGLGIQKIKTAYPDTSVALKRLRNILDNMQAKGIAFQQERAYLLHHMPTAKQLRTWMQTPAFEYLRTRVRHMAESFLLARLPVSVTSDSYFLRSGAHIAMQLYRDKLTTHEAPDFLSPYMLARLLRLCHEDGMAYKILETFAGRPDLLDSRVSAYTEYGVPELCSIFYRLLGNKTEEAHTLPDDVQDTAAQANIHIKSLTRRVDDTFMSNREHVLALYRESANEALLCSLIFHDLQAGHWDGITLLSARKSAPETITQLAAKLCKWKSADNWKALKGIIKNVPMETGIMLAPFIAIANKVNAVSMKGVIDALKYPRSKIFGQALQLMQENLANLYESEYKQELCTWQTESPIALLPLLLSAMSTGATRTKESVILAAIEACFTLQERGLTLYSWYMANILSSLSKIKDEHRARLQDILNSRSDLPQLPGIVIYANAEDMLLKKFLELANELSGTHSAASAADTARLEWRIEVSALGHVTGIVPILRKRSAKGTLSSGRQVSLDSLTRGKYDAYVTREDKGILSQIRHEHSYYENYYYLPVEAAAKLCDHPHVRVLIDGEETLQATLTRKSPRLSLKETGGQLEIKLPADAERVRLERTGETAFDLYMPTPGVGKMKQLIQSAQDSGRLRLPMSAKSEIAEALKSITGQFTLSGDLQFTNEHLREVNEHPRIVINLKGAQDTLSGTIRIEPFAGGPLMPPGKGEPQQIVYDGQEQVLLKRALKNERALVDDLLARCPTLSSATTPDLSLQANDLETALDLLNELQEYGSEKIEVRWPAGCALSLSTLTSMKSFQVTASEDSEHWLEIGGKVQVDENLVLHFTDLLRLYRERSGGYIQLNENHFLRLTAGICRQLDTLSALQSPPDKAGKTRKKLTLTRAAVALLARNCTPEQLPVNLEKHVQQFRDLAEQQSAPPLPRTLRAELRDYQRSGFRWLMQQTGCGLGACLADDMGLGKTLQILTVLLALAKEGPSLVLAPASVCGNWVREAARFTPTLRTHLLSQSQREETLRELGPRDVLVCSYGLLVSEADLLCSMKWNVVVLDEAQAIKNSQSQRAEATRRLQARHRIAATGTPLENNLMELWSLMQFLNPEYLGAHSSFMSRFKNATGQLHKLVAPFILRRLKHDVLDELPDKTEQVIHIDLSQEERALYESIRRTALQQMNDSTGRFQVLAMLTRLRRLCCHPQLVAPDCGITAPAKMEALRELAAELKASGHRALIFSQFTDVLAHVQQLCQEEQHTFLYLDGSTPAASRMQLVDTFQQGETDFFLISLKAGGVGLNLTAADYVILLDPWWNPAVEDQAADRTYRIGQQKAVTVCRLVCADTIEEKVLALHARKREMFDSIINETESDSTTFSVQELMELLN